MPRHCFAQKSYFKDDIKAAFLASHQIGPQQDLLKIFGVNTKSLSGKGHRD
jgi:hypothetical protein